MKRVLLCLATVFFVITLLAGCNKKTEAVQSTTTPVASSQTNGVVTYPVTGAPTVTIARTVDTDITPGGFSSYNDTPGIKSLIEQTGINVQFTELVDATAYLLYLAGGNLPDIILASKTFYPGGPSKMHEDGLARDLTDLLPQYAPDYWKFVNSNEVYYKAIREPDGKHYSFAGYFRIPDSLNASWIGLIARDDFLKKLNMPSPETADDFYQFLSRAKNELGVKTPFMMARNYFEQVFTGGSLTSPFGLPRTDAYHIDGKVHFGAYEPQYKDVLTYFNKLYKEGLLDANFAVTDEPTAHASVLGGNTAVIFSAVSRIQVLTAAANNAADFNLVALPSMARAKGEMPMHSYADSPVTLGMWCFLPETSKNPEAALKLLNYGFTEKGNILVNFGQEGKTFNFVNNEPVFTDFVVKNQEGLTLDGILRAYAILNWPIVQDERMTRQRFPMQSQVRAMEIWGHSDGSKYRIINNTIMADYVDEYAALVTDINTFVTESKAQFISGALSLDRFDSYYIQGLKTMGIDRLLEILQTSYDLYNK